MTTKRLKREAAIPAPILGGLHSRLPYAVLALSVLVIDRASKWLVERAFLLWESRTVVPGFFDLTYVQNTGIAFGMFASLESSLKTAVFAAFAAGAAILIVLFSLRSPADSRLLQNGLALLLAGALGNLYDRIALGYVVDFLDFHVRGYHWPAFNVADAAITIGVGLLIVDMFRTPNEA